MPQILVLLRTTLLLLRTTLLLRATLLLVSYFIRIIAGFQVAAIHLVRVLASVLKAEVFWNIAGVRADFRSHQSPSLDKVHLSKVGGSLPEVHVNESVVIYC